MRILLINPTDTLIGSRIPLEVENTDAATLRLIRKNGAIAKDRERVRLLMQHDNSSMDRI
jgi:hypothetical protein